MSNQRGAAVSPFSVEEVTWLSSVFERVNEAHPSWAWSLHGLLWCAGPNTRLHEITLDSALLTKLLTIAEPRSQARVIAWVMSQAIREYVLDVSSYLVTDLKLLRLLMKNVDDEEVFHAFRRFKNGIVNEDFLISCCMTLWSLDMTRNQAFLFFEMGQFLIFQNPRSLTHRLELSEERKTKLLNEPDLIPALVVALQFHLVTCESTLKSFFLHIAYHNPDYYLINVLYVILTHPDAPRLLTPDDWQKIREWFVPISEMFKTHPLLKDVRDLLRPKEKPNRNRGWEKDNLRRSDGLAEHNKIHENERHKHPIQGRPRGNSVEEAQERARELEKQKKKQAKCRESITKLEKEIRDLHDKKLSLERELKDGAQPTKPPPTGTKPMTYEEKRKEREYLEEQQKIREQRAEWNAKKQREIRQVALNLEAIQSQKKIYEDALRYDDYSHLPNMLNKTLDWLANQLIP